MVMLLVLAFLTVGLATSSCPIYSCSSLDSNVCAKQEANGNVLVNSNGCGEGMGCYLYLAVTYFSYSTDNIWPCLQMPSEFDWDSYYSQYYTNSEMKDAMESTIGTLCNITLVEGRSFDNGQTSPRICSVHSDCLLEDGTYTLCKCAARNDGNKVCMRELSNHQVFPDLYHFCQRGDFTSSRFEEFTYLILYYVSVEILQSDITCADKFEEWIYLDSPENTYVTAETRDGKIGSGAALVLEVLCVTLLT